MSTVFLFKSFNDFEGILSDHQLFVCRDQETFNSCIVRGDDGLFSSDLVLERIDLDAEVSKVVADEFSHCDVVLTYSGCEYDSVASVHLSDVSSDVESYLVSEYLESKSCSFVSFCYCCLDVSEVGGYAGDSEYAGLL